MLGVLYSQGGYSQLPANVSISSFSMMFDVGLSQQNIFSISLNVGLSVKKKFPLYVRFWLIKAPLLADWAKKDLEDSVWTKQTPKGGDWNK